MGGEQSTGKVQCLETIVGGDVGQKDSSRTEGTVVKTSPVVGLETLMLL